MTKKQNDIFQSILQQLRNDLQYLVDHTTVSAKFIQKQNRILKSLTEYYNSTNAHIEFLTKENATVRMERLHSIEKLKDKLTCFEAICIMHGIMDFPMWMSFGKIILQFKATTIQENNKMLVPSMLKEKLEKLSPAEKKVVETILFRNNRKTLQQYVKRLQQTEQQTLQQNKTA